MPNFNAERFDAKANKWESFEIANCPTIAAFGWTSLGDGKMMVLGGTDGDVMQESQWLIDFKNKSAKMEETEFN